MSATSVVSPAASTISQIQVGGLVVRFADKRAHVDALTGVSLSVEQNEFLALVGRSGSGKSTLLRALGGLVKASAGIVRIGDETVRSPPSQVRFVAQDYSQSLLPWLTVAENVRFGERHAARGDTDGTVPVDQIIDHVGLRDAADRYPRELSGGMQQRVAIARAIASRPTILLLDEAFGSVDALSRATLQDMMLHLWSRFRFTAILVTHDIDEAIYMSDRVIVLNERGRGLDADVTIALPRPRHQIATREHPRYLEHRRALLGYLLSEPMPDAATAS